MAKVTHIMRFAKIDHNVTVEIDGVVKLDGKELPASAVVYGMHMGFYNPLLDSYADDKGDDAAATTSARKNFDKKLASMVAGTSAIGTKEGDEAARLTRETAKAVATKMWLAANVGKKKKDAAKNGEAIKRLMIEWLKTPAAKEEYQSKRRMLLRITRTPAGVLPGNAVIEKTKEARTDAEARVEEGDPIAPVETKTA